MRSVARTGTALVAAFAFCGQTLAQSATTAVGDGEGEVRIVAWPGYIERGETDKA